MTTPIAIILCDGSSDGNPWFSKTLDVLIQHFKSFNCDVMFPSTLTLGMSACNNVERRMVPLSKALEDVSLPPDTLGTHFDLQGKTTDIKFKKQTFKDAGQLLAETLSELVLDKFLVVSKYVEGLALNPVPINNTRFARHFRISQYLFQTLKYTK